jgi:hypothetical protein
MSFYAIFTVLKPVELTYTLAKTGRRQKFYQVCLSGFENGVIILRMFSRHFS